MDLNKLYEKYPHLFQFMINNFDAAQEEKEDITKLRAVFSAFNSERVNSYPFYKPISKIIVPRDNDAKDV